jgi:hypothetical protein
VRILVGVAAGPNGVAVHSVVQDGLVPVDGVPMGRALRTKVVLSLNIRLQASAAADANTQRQKQVHNER